MRSQEAVPLIWPLISGVINPECLVQKLRHEMEFLSTIAMCLDSRSVLEVSLSIPVMNLFKRLFDLFSDAF